MVGIVPRLFALCAIEIQKIFDPTRGLDTIAQDEVFAQAVVLLGVRQDQSNEV